MINAPSNLFYFQFPIFKNSLSEVYTFLKLDTCQYFTSKGFQKLKQTPKSLNAFKKIFYTVLVMSSELSSLHFRSIELTKFTQMQE